MEALPKACEVNVAKVTIYDIAREAGVGPASVQVALSRLAGAGLADVSPARGVVSDVLIKPGPLKAEEALLLIRVSRPFEAVSTGIAPSLREQVDERLVRVGIHDERAQPVRVERRDLFAVLCRVLAQEVLRHQRNVGGPLAQRGHEVYVEAGAGEGRAFPDAEYEAGGARLAGADEVWEAGDPLLKGKEPIGAADPGPPAGPGARDARRN